MTQQALDILRKCIKGLIQSQIKLLPLKSQIYNNQSLQFLKAYLKMKQTYQNQLIIQT
ncbi:unnamed protein product [Paramecium sonneborni]|uniref:Uncharacterized protein n=1 Tax=Paramecium sonneborni TaxID=65129 RepID=A0A8S1KVM8_9CILI|nr:unnamed protein product [Paramecium sonneborni]